MVPTGLSTEQGFLNEDLGGRTAIWSQCSRHVVDILTTCSGVFICSEHPLVLMSDLSGATRTKQQPQLSTWSTLPHHAWREKQLLSTRMSGIRKTWWPTNGLSKRCSHSLRSGAEAPGSRHQERVSCPADVCVVPARLRRHYNLQAPSISQLWTQGRQ